jgi:hypothetical protein
MRSHCRTALVLLALLAGGVVLDATVVVPMDLRELVSQATVIAYGRVTGVRSVVVNDRTESVVTLGAPFYVKGSGGREVQFRVPGGRIGRYRTIVLGAPDPQAGDEVVVFLTGDGPVATLLGFSQGLLKVARPSDGAVPMVLAPPVSRDAIAQRVVRGSGVPRFVPLASFVEDVRGLMTSSPGTRTPGNRETGGPGKTGGW